MTTASTAAVEAINERLGPALETLDENMRKARRLFVRGRHAAEDAVAAAALEVRRRPAAALVAIAGAGALVGLAVGFMIGSRCGRR
jgi:ElaB/YqjD/DUF883 family membrane-anchored ribosome-binding protein